MDRQKDRKVDTDSYKEVTPYKKNIRPIHWFENRRGHLPLPPNYLNAPGKFKVKEGVKFFANVPFRSMEKFIQINDYANMFVCVHLLIGTLS